jgi:hypothetical protein
MATYVNDLRLTELATGEGSGTWGTTTNTSLELIGEALGYATQQAFGSDADATTTVADGASDPARAMYYKITSAASLTATRTLTIAPNTISRVMFIENATSGSQSIAISQGSGANVTIATGKTAVVYLDGAGSGAAVVDAMLGVDPGVTDTLTEVLVAGNTSGGTNIELSTTDKVQFRDTGIYINSSVDGQLDIIADTEIQIAATTVDLNGNLDVSGTALVAGVLTTTAATVFNGGFASNADSTLGTDKKVQFRDSAIYINSSVDGQLDIVADTEIQIAATTIDINGTIVATTSTDQAFPLTVTNSDSDSHTYIKYLDQGGQYWTTGINYASNDFVMAYGGTNVAVFANAGGLTVTSADNLPQLTLISTDADAAVGPQLNLWRNSGSAANGDLIGQITFTGEDSLSNTITYASIHGVADQVDNGAEDGSIRFSTRFNDVLAEMLAIGSSTNGVTINDTGIDADFRVESDSNTHMLFVDGGNNRVGIGTGSPIGDVQIVTATAGTVFNVNHDTGGSYPKASGIGLGATSTAYTVSSDGGTVSFTGGAGIYAENTAVSGNPTNLVFWTNLAGTPDQALSIGGNNVATFASTVSTPTLASPDGTTNITLQNTGEASFPRSAVFNEAGVDSDFRVESDTLTSALFVDGGTGNVTMQGATTTIGSAAASTNIQLNLNGVASKTQRIKFQESGVDRWLIGQGAASETSAFELYNAGGVIALSVDRTSNIATFQRGAVFNEGSADSDFRVESDNDTHALFVDGSSGIVSCGTSGVVVDLVVPAANVIADQAFGINNGSNKTQFSADRINFNTGQYYVLNESNVGVILTNGNTSWAAQSDESLKENISDLGPVLDKVVNYRCVNYSLKSTQSSDADKIGFIAQDWESDFPNVVNADEDGLLAMRYTETIPVLLKAIQEQQEIIKTLEARITALES